jgi:hypothetical protein
MYGVVYKRECPRYSAWDPQAAQVLDQFDRREVENEQDAIHTEVTQVQAFKKSYRAKVTAVRAATAAATAAAAVAAAPPAAAASRGRRRPAAATAAATAAAERVRVPLPAGVIEQSDIRHLLPEGVHVWRANTSHSWCGHCPPYQRVSAPWNVHGHRVSLVIVLRKLWSQFLEKSGLRDPEDCWVLGLFSDAAMGDGGVEEIAESHR